MPRLTVMTLTSKTDKLLRAGRIFITIAIIGLVAASIYSARRISRITDNVRMTNNRLRLTEEVLLHSINNTSAARGYALTGDSSFLTTIRKTANGLDEDIRNLLSVYNDDADMRNRLDSLQKYVSGRRLLSDSVISIRDKGGLEQTASFMDNPGKVRYLEHIQRILSGMEEHERINLKKYNESRDDFFSLLNNLLLGVIVLIMIFSSLVMWLAMRELAKRKATQSLLENYNTRLQQEVEKETKSRLQIFERITDAFVALDPEFCYIYANKRAGEILNRDPQKMLGRYIWTEFPEGATMPFKQAYENAMKDQKHISLQEHFPSHGLWLETNIYPSAEGLSVFFRDITERKKTEEKTQRTTRLYNFVSQVNQLIIYAHDERRLFKEICDISVAVGDFEMSWVGLINESESTIVPVAHAGDKTGYLAQLTKTTALNLKESTGPTASAIRIGKTVASNNIQKDPIMVPWRESAKKSGFCSSAAIPVKRKGKAIGALCLYAQEQDFFGADEVFLLEDVAKSISYVLDRFENEKEKERAAQALRESEAFSDSLLAASPDIIYIYDIVKGRNIYINDGVEKNLGFTSKEITEMGDNVLVRLMHPDDFNHYLANIYPRYAELGESKVLTNEYRMSDKNENWRWLESKETVYLRDAAGNPVQIFGVATDITERKNREAVLAEKEHQLRLFVEYSPASIAMLDSNMRYMVVSKRWLVDNQLEGTDVTGMSHYEVVPNISDEWKDIHARCLGGATEKRDEDILIMRDGTAEWLKWEILPWYKASGVVGGIVIFSEYITERKKAELEILQSKERLERGEEHAQMGSWEYDVITQRGRWSKQMFRFFGLPIAEHPPSVEAYLELIHKDDRTAVSKVFTDMQEGKPPAISIYRTNPEKIPLRYLMPSWSFEKNENGRIVRLSGTLIDITSQIAVEKAIEEEKKVSDRIINTLPGVFYLYNKEGKFLRWNAKFSAVTGYSDSEIRQLHPLMLLPEKDKEKLVSKYANVLENKEESAEVEFITKSGEAIPYYFTGVAIEYEGETCVMGVGIDISDTTKTRRQILEVTEMMERAEAHAHMGSWEYDVVKQLGKWSKQTFRFFNLPYSDTPPSFGDYLELIHEDDRPAIAKMLEDIQQGIIPTIPMYRTNPEKLPLRYLKPSWAADRDENGNVIRIYGADIDVTEQIHSAKAISTEKILSDTVINSLPGVFSMFDSKGTPLRWNHNFETIMGYSAVEISKMNPVEFFAATDRERISKNFAGVLEKGGNSFEVTFKTKRGELIPYYLVSRAVEYQGEICMIGLGIDISERKKKEEEVREISDQLRSLMAHQQTVREEERKRIAREIHDELGQQLTAVKMDVAWIDKKVPDESDLLKKKLKNVIGLLDSSNLSIRKILNELRMGILDHYNIVEALKLQGQQFSGQTGVNLTFESDRPDVQTTETMATCLYRVYQEALTNITRYAGAAKVITKLWQDDESVYLQITDDGKGFDKNVLKSGRSFGVLGMKERVASLQGTFDLKTAPGKGTQITISIPLSNTNNNQII